MNKKEKIGRENFGEHIYPEKWAIEFEDKFGENEEVLVSGTREDVKQFIQKTLISQREEVIDFIAEDLEYQPICLICKEKVLQLLRSIKK